jgi:2-methylisocitrate lyase-like PEP mutase family enzyme
MQQTSGTNGHTPKNVHAATKLRGMLNSTDDIIVAPGVYDGFSARIATEVGFDCLYMVSLSAYLYNDSTLTRS